MTATITVTAPPPAGTAPSITTQPQSQTINSGQTSSLSVGAEGTGPLSFQWYQGASGTTSSPVGGATARGLHDAGAHGDDELLGARLERVRHVRFVDRDHDGQRAAPGGRRAVHHASAAEPDDQFGPDRDAGLRRERHRAVELSVVRRSKRRDFVARRRRDIASYTTPALTATTSYWVRVSNPFGVASSSAATMTVIADTSNPSAEDQVLVLVNQRRAAGATCGGTVYPPAGPLTMNANLQRPRGSTARTWRRRITSRIRASTAARSISASANAGYAGSFPLGENIAAGAVESRSPSSTAGCTAPATARTS